MGIAEFKLMRRSATGTCIKHGKRSHLGWEGYYRIKLCVYIYMYICCICIYIYKFMCCCFLTMVH